ncbi:MAG: DEAD/DEAH box helicase, partial [Nitrospirae bacterium]|nr:DEAD/DEAH box helicase [Nitrospirota bacterium]
MERLQHIVQLLSRPIEFASRDAYAHLAAVKNLGPYVSRQIFQALADEVYPPSVETDLLTLRQLFTDFDDGLDPAEQQRRLAGARAILRRLSTMSEGHEAPGQSAPELWNLPIRYAKGVGPKRAALLEKLGVRTVEDALWFLPWRYEDRSVVTAIGQLSPGPRATICGTIRSSDLKRTPRRGMAVLDVTVEDATGLVHSVFFNQPYLETLLKPGARVMMSGVVSAGRKGWTDLRMDAPQYEILGGDAETPLHVGRIVPIYHETRGLSCRLLRTILKGLLDQYLGDLHDILPESLRAKHRLPTIQAALSEVHFPSPQANLDAFDRGTTPAHRRLAFEEFLLLELALAVRHRSVKEEIKGIRFTIGTPLGTRLRHLLPFRLTAAQERVLAEIQRDMASPRPMNRLIQGDVGCGKTIVALCAILIACGSGYQAALMVPTEVLAEQHYLNLRKLIQALGLEVVLLKSGGSAKARTAILRQIKTGEARVVIGTHALIQ